MSILALMNIGLSGLETADQQLQVTGNNVANSQTPDYTVEQANVSTVPSGIISAKGSTGNGVQVSNITRSYNSFVNAQVNAENSNVSYWTNYNTAITQVQDVFNEASSSGISPAITTFFDDWQNIAQNPQDAAQRTTLIADATSLSNSLNTAAASLNSVSDQLLASSQTLVTQVNTYSSQIATLNGELAGNPGSLDLQDQRDALVNKLNGIVKVSTYQDPASGMYSVMVGGAPLVEGNESYNMSVATDSSNNMRFYVSVVPNSAEGSPGEPDITSLITGGEIKANIDLRDTQIPGYINQLNAFAVDLADTTNYYQTQGYGLDGSTGTNFFQPLSFQAKYTSVDSVAGLFTSPNETFSTNGGTLSIKLGDNDASPATVNVAAGSTLQQTVTDINEQAGSKVTASVVNLGTTASPDYRISIQSNPVGNLGNVKIGVVSTNDAAGSGLNLLATSPMLASGTPGAAGTVMSSVSVTDPAQTVANAQYKIDYNYSGGAGYQEDGTTGIYWRVMESTDGGGTWTTVPPNTSYNPSDPSTINQSDVNLTSDSTGLSRTLEFQGIQVQIDGTGINSTTNPNGETFGVQLDSKAAEDIGTTITDPNQVAASSDTWDINSSNNSVVFNVNGGPDITAVIPSGTYTNDPGQSDDISAALTSAIQTAYQSSTGSALSDTLKVAFNPNTKQFNITMPSGSDSINFLWSSNSSSTANQVFGFSKDASLNSFAINAGNDAIVFNDGSGPTPATISTVGSPYTGANLAAAINTALTTAEPLTHLSVAYNQATNNFTITNSGGAVATINWAIPQDFGFPPGTLDVPAKVGAVNGSVSSAAVGSSAVSDNPASVETNATQGLPGDNSNAQTIFNQSNGTRFAGTTPTDMYMSMVSNVGVDASSANTNLQYHTSLMSELSQQQQQVSGVSMDAEASNLVVYQKSYEAAAQLITTANQMLTTLLQMVNPNA